MMKTTTTIEDYGKTLKITMDRVIAANVLSGLAKPSRHIETITFGYPCLGIYKDIVIIPDGGVSRMVEGVDPEHLLLIYLAEDDIYSLCCWLLKILILGWNTTSCIKLGNKNLCFAVQPG